MITRKVQQEELFSIQQSDMSDVRYLICLYFNSISLLIYSKLSQCLRSFVYFSFSVL